MRLRSFAIDQTHYRWTVFDWAFGCCLVGHNGRATAVAAAMETIVMQIRCGTDDAGENVVAASFRMTYEWMTAKYSHRSDHYHRQRQRHSRWTLVLLRRRRHRP